MASTVRDRQRGERKQARKSEGNGAPARAGGSPRGGGRGTGGGPVKSSHIITEHIDVGVPADEAFSCWTQYDKWSRIFKNESAHEGGSGGGERARRRQRVKVTAKIGPSERQWTAEVVDAEPGHRIRWNSKGPLKAKGTTTFHRLDDRLTRLMAEMEYEPTGLVEIVGNFFRMQRRRVRRDLRLFKNYVELQGRMGPAGEEESD